MKITETITAICEFADELFNIVAGIAVTISAFVLLLGAIGWALQIFI